jgi:low temperature requirement protein LtrA
VFAIAATCWAWINFSWFSSAYDTDDWFYRVCTMVQMIGVVIFALGLPTMFHSLEAGGGIDNSVMVAGYVVMRVALLVQWLRAARQDPERRRTALGYALAVGIAQVGWIALAALQTSAGLFFALAAALWVIELGGPVLAERRSSGTPWHPHHIAERYGLLAIIALGEGVIGTVAAVNPIVTEQGWTMDAVLVVVAGIGLTFGLWWNYFLLPAGRVLARHRERSWAWGYGHIVLFGSIAATGAGLHAAAYVVEGHAEIGVPGAILSLAIPVLVFTLALFTIYTVLLGEFDPFHVLLVAATVVALVAAVLLAFAGASLSVCLVVLTLAPTITVVGFETVGHRHQAAALERILA